MPNGTYGGVRGRKTKVGRKLLRFPPTRFCFLSAGKGVLIPGTLEQAEKEQKEMLGGMFGGASTCTTVCKMDKKQRESSWVPSVAYLGVRFLLRFSRRVRP